MQTPARTTTPLPGSEPAQVTDAGVESLPRARWRAAESRLYPLITADPDLYEAAVTLVAEAAAVLRSEGAGLAELLQADAAAVLARCPSATELPALGLDPGVVLDAARAHRWRELSLDQPGAEPAATVGGRR